MAAVAARLTLRPSDPNNVTIFGESGGGWKVCNALVAPAAKGLFHRVYPDSVITPSTATATATAERLLAAGPARSEVDKLQSLPRTAD
jgi:para-nitrobenzyl esterase